MKPFALKTYRKLRYRYRNLIHGKPVLVAMYHRIGDQADEGMGKLTVSQAAFEEQLVRLKREFVPLRLEDDWSKLRRKGFVVTFDDGYAETLELAVPILEKHNIPATFFITTENLGTGEEFWWDRLASAVMHLPEIYRQPGLAAAKQKHPATFSSLAGTIEKMTVSERNAWLQELESLNGIAFSPRDSYLALSWERLAKLAGHPLVSIGLHTHHHQFLGKMSREEQVAEFDISEAKLREQFLKYHPFMAVPFGSSNADTLRVAREKKTTLLFANDALCRLRDKHMGLINRVLVPNICGVAFEVFLQNFFL